MIFFNTPFALTQLLIYAVTRPPLHKCTFTITKPTPEILRNLKNFGSVKLKKLGIFLFVSQHSNLQMWIRKILSAIIIKFYV